MEDTKTHTFALVWPLDQCAEYYSRFLFVNFTNIYANSIFCTNAILRNKSLGQVKLNNEHKVEFGPRH